MSRLITSPVVLALLLSSSVISTAFAESPPPSISPKSASSQKQDTSQKAAPPTAQPKKPEIGAISRSTGHLFREGLASGIAADRVDTHKPPENTANDHGLLDTKKDGSFGNTIWNNATPDVFTDMIHKLQPSTQIPIMNTMARRLLLTDAPWPKGNDLKAIRIEKMIAFGAVDEAANLYHFWSPDSSNTRLTRAGVQALYLTGKTASACLEINTNTAVIKAGDAFWDKAKESCATLTFDSTSKKPPISDHIARILSTIPTELREKIITLYAEQSANGPQNAESRAKKLIPLFRDLPWSARTLFTPTFIPLSPDFTDKNDEIRVILGTLLASNNNGSAPWVKKLRDHLPHPMVSDPEASALLLLAQMRGIDAPKSTIPFKFEGISDATGHHQAKLFIKLTELLDTAPNFIDNPPVTYEKKKGLTQADHYVMPVEMLRNNLAKGRENRARGQVLLTILITLQSNKIGDIDPDLFSDIMAYLMSAGLNEEARQTATYVFLGALR